MGSKISSMVTGRASNTAIVSMIRFARSQFGVVPKKGELVRLAFDLAEEYLDHAGMVEKEKDENVAAEIVAHTYSGELRIAKESRSREELVSTFGKSYARQMQENYSFENQVLENKIKLDRSVTEDYEELQDRIGERDRRREEERQAMIVEAKRRAALSGIVVESETITTPSEEEMQREREESEELLSSLKIRR